jgi:hypothetical protein
LNFRILSAHSDQEKFIAPIMATMGSKIPAKDQGVIFTQFDDAGEVVAFQILQSGLFAEGLWARDGSAHLRTLCNMMLKYLEENGLKGRTLLTMTREDASGERIGKAAEYMGFEQTGWKVYRREI